MQNESEYSEFFFSKKESPTMEAHFKNPQGAKIHFLVKEIVSSAIVQTFIIEAFCFTTFNSWYTIFLVEAMCGISWTVWCPSLVVEWICR